MNMILIGPPGAGKGTQAKQLADRHAMMHISTGDLLRKAVLDGTPLGLKAKAYMDAGQLVPDDVMIDLISEVLPKNKGFLLDGFPRTQEQAKALEKMLQAARLSLSVVVNLDVADDRVVERLSLRRQCKSGHISSVAQTKVAGDCCPICKAEVFQRSDDEEVTIRKRLAVYHSQTAPLIAYYRSKGILKTVDGAGKPSDVFASIEREVQVTA